MYETKEDTNLTFHTYTHNLEQVQLEIIYRIERRS